MEWIIFALLAAITMAAQVEANRHYNCDGLQLNFWRAALSAAILLVPACLMPWPSDWQVYALAAFDGVGAVFTCTLLFNLAARKQSRVSSLYSPLTTLVALLFWLSISSAEQDRLQAYPIAAVLIVAALGIAAFGLNRLRANDASWAAFVAVLPVGIFYGFADVLARLVLTGHDMLPILVVFGFVAAVATVAANGAVLLHRRALQRPDRMMAKGAIAMAVASTLFGFLLMPAIILAPNPAYPSFFLMTMPVMLLVYHHLSGVNDDADWRAALLIVAGAMLASIQGVWFV